MRKALAILCLTLLFNSCEEQKIQPILDDTVNQKKLPVQESWDAEIYFSEDGILKAVLYTDHLMMYDDPKETLLDRVKIDFYDEDGNKTSNLTSKHGKVDDLKKNMFAYDDVVAVNDSGVTLTTEELVWNNNTRKITTDKFVRIISEDETIEGFGLESDQSLSNYVIFDITYYTSASEGRKSE